MTQEEEGPLGPIISGGRGMFWETCPVHIPTPTRRRPDGTDTPRYSATPSTCPICQENRTTDAHRPAARNMRQPPLCQHVH